MIDNICYLYDSDAIFTISGFIFAIFLCIPFSMPYFLVRHLKGSKKTTWFWLACLVISFAPCFLHAIIFIAPLLISYLVSRYFSQGDYIVKSYVGHQMATEYAEIHTRLMRNGMNPNYQGFFSKGSDAIKEQMAKEAFNEALVIFHNGRPVQGMCVTVDYVSDCHTVEWAIATAADFKKLGLASYIMNVAKCSPRFLCYQLWYALFLNEPMAYAARYGSPISYYMIAKKHPETYPSPNFPTVQDFPNGWRHHYENIRKEMFGIDDQPLNDFATKGAFPDITKFDAKRGNEFTEFYFKLNPMYPENTQTPLALVPINLSNTILVNFYYLMTIKPKAPPTKKMLPYEGKIVAIVDPVSSGADLAKHVVTNGARVIAITTKGCDIDVKPGQNFLDQFIHESIDDTIQRIQIVGQIDAILIGYDTGVTVAEKIASKLGLRGNNPSFDRRNKFIQQEKCRSYGIDAARQVYATSMQEVDEFLSTFNPSPFRAVVKPVDGAGTLSVIRCNSPVEVRNAFLTVQGLHCYGNVCSGALIQEFLAGTEFVVNSVTIDGKHKINGLFYYDRHAAYGSDFVYFGIRAMKLDDLRRGTLIEYALGVLTAMEIQNGGCHLEIMLTQRGPVLVEANCRIAGAAGHVSLMEKLLSGRGQIELYADSMLNPQNFASIPDVPRMKGDAVLGFYHVNKHGVIEGPNEKALTKFENTSSFIIGKYWISEGTIVQKTGGDMDTLLGSCVLYNEDSMQLEKDYQMLHQINGGSSLVIVKEAKTPMHNISIPPLDLTEVGSEGN